MPRPADAARPTQEHLRKSPALSIQLNGPASFKGRKVGALVTDGVDSAILQALRTALEKEGALLEIVAPHVGGVEASDGSWVEAAQQLHGGPSVLYDAVALLPSADGVELLMQEPTARDFVADAFAHCKFIGYVKAALPLFGKAGVSDSHDDECIALEDRRDARHSLQRAVSCASGRVRPSCSTWRGADERLLSPADLARGHWHSGSCPETSWRFYGPLALLLLFGI